MTMLRMIAAMLPLAVPAGAAMASGYSGTWPVTLSHSKYANGTYCLKLTDDGAFGWPHSGLASISGAGVGGTLPYGTFQLIDHLLTVTIEESGDSGQNAGLVLMAPASAGTISKGVYDQVYGGEEFDSGVAAFGAKGGC